MKFRLGSTTSPMLILSIDKFYIHLGFRLKKPSLVTA